jgi:CHASE2 domain-containing sensor protein
MKKPLHKHIGHHTRRFGKQFTKYLYERDTIFATLWVFIFIVALGSIPLNLGIMNPVKLGLKDFDFNDLSYSKLGKAQKTPIDSRIVVINIGQANREQIAYLVDKTASYHPKVMGLDVLFNGPRDPMQDSLLSETIKRNKNLVVAVKYGVDSTDRLVATENYFLPDATHTGYVNFPNEDYETTRGYYPFKQDEKDKELVLPSFSSTLIKLYDDTDSVYSKIKKKVDKKVIINYTRKVTDIKKQYQVIEPDQLLTDNVDSAAIRGKIALLAYVNIDPTDIEDKKFTPMNPKFAGKSVPDMNGIFVHANIISMVLDKNYIKKVPLWATVLIAIVVCWLHMSFFVRYYLENHIWFHLVAKIAQVASAIFFVWLGIYLFDQYRLKVDLKLSLITIVMAVDVIYFYEAWAVWMHKKYHYHTVFKPHHH